MNGKLVFFNWIRFMVDALMVLVLKGLSLVGWEHVIERISCPAHWFYFSTFKKYLFYQKKHISGINLDQGPITPAPKYDPISNYFPLQ